MKSIRLGNVLNSPGSVVPLFAEQIASGKPLTVTHADVRRYFMTVDEAVTALLEAASPRIGSGVLVPALGQPIRVLDLAQYMIWALRPDSNIAHEIALTGLRPGDKLQEVLIAQNESWASSLDDGALLRRIRSPFPAVDFGPVLADLRRAVQERNLSEMLQIIARLIPQYKPDLAHLDKKVPRTTTAGATP
jgi:FlaA1/EpsC-like NDP-sugar epimerase